MSVSINILVSYLPAVLYLMVMTFAAVRLGKVPFWAHPALIVPGLVVRVLTATDRVDVAIAAGAGALLFLGGVFFLARVVSGATLFTVVGAFTLAPLWWGYPGIGAGLVVAGVLRVEYRTQVGCAACPWDGVADLVRVRGRFRRASRSGPGGDPREETGP